MFKKIDVLVLKAIIGPFIATLFVGNFVFLMQFLYRKMEHLVGKGLGIDVLGQFMMYASTTLIPYSLPLAVLLSSIMAMGNLGERFELTSLKSSGISLMRVFRPLIIASIGMAGIAFFFSNNVMPYSKLKLSTLYYDIRNKKPSVLLQPNVFFDEFDNMVIKVGDKNENDRLFDVLIYDHRKSGQTRVIRADSADLIASDSTVFLKMHLMSGKLFEDKDIKNQFTRFSFDTLNLVVDMSGFELGATDEGLFKDDARLKNVSQLSRSMDSLDSVILDRQKILDSDVKEKFYLIKALDENVVNISDKKEAGITFQELSQREQVKLVNRMKPRMRAMLQELNAANADLTYRKGKLNEHKIAWYEKFALAFSCVVLFFVGAPLGALIRKGGFGMPVIIAVVLYIIYYILNTMGKKFAEEGVLTPVLGMWMSTIILFPLALWLTRMAVTDSAIFTGQKFQMIGEFFAKIIKKKK